MIDEYKENTALDSDSLIKFSKLSSPEITCQNPNFDKIYELISAFIEFYDKVIITNYKENESTSNFNYMKFAFNFCPLLIERLKITLNNEYNVDEFFQKPTFIGASESCLLNLELISQNQLDKFDVNPFLSILEMFYYDKDREKALEIFPVSFIVNELSTIIKSDINKYGLNYLRCFYAICALPHTAEESRMIFNEIVYLQEFLKDDNSIIFICYIISKMDSYETLPIDLLKESQFPEYLCNLAQSQNTKIVENSLILIGKFLYNKICNFEKLTWGFFIDDLLFANRDNERIFVLTLWILSTCIDQDYANELIECDKFDEIVDLYKDSTINSKIELSLFVSDVLMLTNQHFDKFLTFDILSLIVDSLFIGNNQAVDRMVNYLLNIFETLSNPNDEYIDLEQVIDHLLKEGIFCALDALLDGEYGEYQHSIEMLYSYLESFTNQTE